MTRSIHSQDVGVWCVVLGGLIGCAAGLLIATIHRVSLPDLEPALMIQSSSQYILWIYGGLFLGGAAGAFIAWRWRRTGGP